MNRYILQHAQSYACYLENQIQYTDKATHAKPGAGGRALAVAGMYMQEGINKQFNGHHHHTPGGLLAPLGPYAI